MEESRKEGETKRSHRDRDREKEKKGDKHKDKDRVDKRDRDSRRYEREKSSDSEERYVREKHRDKDVDRIRSRDDERERSKDRKRDKGKERDKEREREKVKEKEKRERKEREKEKERERKEREREAEERVRDKREREKEKNRERRIRERERERHRDVNSDDSEDDVRERSRKRHKKSDSEYKERDRERSVSRSNRHRDDGTESPKKRSDGADSDKKEKATREEELEDEQRKLDEEMEKRRRRVQEWQELKRKKEEDEREKRGEETVDEKKSGKTWTLDGESDDEEAGKSETGMDVDGEGMDVDREVNGENVTDGEIIDAIVPDTDNTTAAAEDEEVDPLDAFMLSVVMPEVEKLNTTVEPSSVDDENKEKTVDSTNGEKLRASSKKSLGRIMPGEDSNSDHGDLENDDDPLENEDDDEFIKRVKKTKAEKLSLVDHSKIDYIPFRKKFYIEVKEISRMTPEEVGAYRKELELKIHGKDVPKPIKSWHQTGLTNKILETIKKLNYEKPMPIQAQALPIVMSGRDCIGIGKTGSGKTLAFVLPMLRHIKDQPPVVAGDGPIGLIMAPTRELVQQIHSDIRKFAKVLGLRCVPVFGGSGVAQQISELKRGTEIVVCTPGRMIDILCTSGGKITNLRRVTYLVMDEADRMFDMGFEPQITRIVQNIRPDRQTVLFSATFPRQVEVLARKVLDKPVEIQVGGRSVVNKDIMQLVEVRQENERFLRLLELLGEWYEKGKILIFVQTQDKCDSLFRDLLKHGYPCLSLHGAKDQTDRESTIADFKSNVCNLLIATSIAARGLDVKELELVINFDAPNHYEDYVHRVGRTGRAGRKGCAITFISEEDARYSPDLVKALELSEQVVPDDLKSLADNFMAKVKQGLAQAHGTGYGGSGFKFNVEEDEVRRAAKKAQAKEYGFEEDKSDSEDEDEGIRKAGGDISQQAALAQIAAIAAASKGTTTAMQTPASAAQLLPNGGLPVSLPGVLGLGVTLPGTAAVVPGTGLPLVGNDGAARAAALAAAMNLQHNLAKIHADAMPEHYEAELEINDFPQNARWKVTHKETLGPISEWTGAAITTRGQYFPPGKVPGPGDRKLYLFIEGPTEQSVKRAKADLKGVLEEISNQALSLPGGNQQGRYQVI
ncbi:DEAD-box ATP-dependent RNA helicase 42 [Argentina anserina]|uniref:DEAD-box ATP-dependent RNA helicase 42 n=1 Tax=Argentina anserina TaxID=57926 RepID=UPI00217638CD|nr:DEAD-box ATP-dependent RNA helicase 42 [Potentilla anserina]